MNQTVYSKVRRASAGDFHAIRKLLQSESLPVEDISPVLPHFFVVERDGKVLAVIGLEICGEEGLLRSLAVDVEYRNQSLATQLIRELISHARDTGVKTIYLITTTAEGYFARKGFTMISRSEVPSSISSTLEFTSLCPSTATVMMMRID